MMPAWLGIGMVLAILGGLFALLRLVQRLASPHPELIRKLLHMGMGLVTLSFPWLFESAWPVVLLAVLSISGLILIRVARTLKDQFGNVLGGVGRVSLGEIYFPLAVGILFLLFLRESEGPAELRLMLYCIPILLLTLADAAAALIGVSYGRFHYHTADGVKSAEGSLAFFTCAFFVVHVPLLLATETGRVETILIALLLGWLATMFEAIAWRGLDNLALPLVSFLLLKIYLGLSPADLLLRLGVTALLIVFLLFFKSRTTLKGSAVLGAFLVCYISWALGGWHWLVAPIVLFMSYTLLSPRTPANTRHVHNVHAVACVSSAGLTWLFLATLLHRHEFLYPYTLAFACHLAMIGIARLKYDYPTRSDVVILVTCILKGWTILFVPYLLIEQIGPRSVPYAIVGLIGIAIAGLAFYCTQPQLDDCPIDTPRWLRQSAEAAMGSLVALVPMYWI